MNGVFYCLQRLLGWTSGRLKCFMNAFTLYVFDIGSQSDLFKMLVVTECKGVNQFER